MDSAHTRAIDDLFPRPPTPNTENRRNITINEANVVRYGNAADSIPLIDAVPPLATSEVDDFGGNDVTKPRDGFFDAEKPDDDTVSIDENHLFNRAGFDGDDENEPLRGGFPQPLEFGGVSRGPESIPDVNIYQHKKTVAQGMMDLALFSANANQLRYVLESSHHPYYYSGIVLITISLAFQVAVGVGLLMNTRYDVKDKKEICIANKINNFTIIGIFLVTVINVFISAFGVASNNNTVTQSV